MALTELDPAVRQFLGRDRQLWIDGGWSGGSGGRIDVIDPAEGARIGSIAEATAGDVDRAVAAARAAFEGPWRRLKPPERARLLHAFADCIEADAEALAQLETLDNGKPVMFARFEVAAAAGAIRYHAGWADKIHGTTHAIAMPGDFHTYTVREPVGVAGLVTPWNYPIVMAAMKLGPALAAGCCVVLKPAEDTSLTALRLAELALDAGLPPGVLNIVTGRGGVTGAALAGRKGIDKLSFTGSTLTGAAIAQAAGANLKKVTLELGGKSPNILFADADLDVAIPASAAGIFHNAGQTCTAPSRLYAHAGIYDRVVEGIVAHGRGLTIAPGLDPACELGPLVSQRQLDRVASHVEAGRREGGAILSGGEPVGDKGYFFAPTIIADVGHEARVMREEIFGPVLVVQRFDDPDAVVRLANDNDYGLGGTIWTRDLATAHRTAKALRAGIIGVNTVMAADWDLPIGGFKQSGYGRENGSEGLDQYLETKSVVVKL